MRVVRLATAAGAVVALSIALLAPASPGGLSTPPPSGEFGCTGAAQTYTVPAGVTKVNVELFGAQGGSGISVDPIDAAAGTGGQGGHTTATIDVTPGETLQVNVGCAGSDAVDVNGGAGGFNGGADGGTGGHFGFQAGGGGGGGASAVRQGGTGLADRVLVAGGGGGGGAALDGLETDGGDGGDGGGTEGTSGGPGLSGPNPEAEGGSGGTQSAGGAGGAGSATGTAGEAGELGDGGPGGTDGVTPAATGGGGGGGGLFGGGGGGAHGSDFGGGGGGGGGSGLGPTLETGVRAGDGLVVITPVVEPITVEPTFTG